MDLTHYEEMPTEQLKNFISRNAAADGLIASVVLAKREGAACPCCGDRPKNELTTARKLVDAILASGTDCTIGIPLDDDFAPRMATRDVSALMDDIHACDDAHVNVYNSERRRIGAFYLVWGNDPTGNELVADHTHNEYCNRIMREVYPTDQD